MKYLTISIIFILLFCQRSWASDDFICLKAGGVLASQYTMASLLGDNFILDSDGFN